MEKISVRLALPNELDWVNSKYSEVDFVPSTMDSEIIAIAEYGKTKAALGRLGKIVEGVFELGGIYTFQDFRGKGLAKVIVTYLLSRRKPGEVFYCLPFANLSEFYESFGFAQSDIDSPEIPQALLSKLVWCNSGIYHETVLLYELR